MDTMPLADVPSSPPLMEDCKEILLQMQKTNPFCKHLSKYLLNGKASHHKTDTFAHFNSLLYKHAMDATQKFLALVNPKSGHFTVFNKAHGKLNHQGINRTYHHQTAVLLERNEQRHLQKYYKLHPL